MKKFHALLVPFVVVIGLSACQSNQTASKNNDGASNNASNTVTPTEPAPAPAPSDNSGTPAKVGVTGFTYQNGLKVAILSVAQGSISDTAAGGQPGDALLTVVVRVTNGTDAVFDTAMVQVNATAGADGTQLDTVFQDGIADFTGSIPVGRSKTAVLGFAVKPADAANVTFEVKPGFQYVSSFFDR